MFASTGSTQDQIKFSECNRNNLSSAAYSPGVLRRLTSACRLFLQLPGAPFLPGNRIDTKSNNDICRLLNLKRAYSWSQVESCKRKGRLFVTADRSAALYAFYRDVPFLLVKMHDYWEFRRKHVSVQLLSI